MKSQYEEFLKQSAENNKKFSECTDEILSLYDEWVRCGFESESEFLKVLNNADLSVFYFENTDGQLCYLRDGNKNIGEPFISVSNDKKDVQNFKTDLMLILFHIASICENEKNKNAIIAKVKDLDKS